MMLAGGESTEYVLMQRMCPSNTDVINKHTHNLDASLCFSPNVRVSLRTNPADRETQLTKADSLC